MCKLHRRDINRVLDPIENRGKYQEALAVFKHLRSMFAWAVERGDLDKSPITGMKAPADGSVRERVLTDDEIAAAWNSEALDATRLALVRLCLLTGQRVGEVAGIRAEEIDTQARTWTIPASRSKNKHAHTVPLTDAAFEIIEAKLAAGGKLFPDAGNSAAIGKALTRAKLGDWTMHDLRRTFTTNLQKLGVSPIVAGHLLNHRTTTKAGETLKVYAQYTYEKEMRETLELWADRLAGIVAGTGAKVIPMHKQA